MDRAELRSAVVPILVGVGLFAFPFVVKNPLGQNVAILALIFATAATGWTLLGGFAGQISFGHAMFFGLGAYATGYLFRAGVSPWFGMALGAALSALVGVLVGFPVFRLRSHYFSIATIAMQQVAYVIVTNAPELGAATGLPLPLREASLANLQFGIRDKTEYHLVALALFAVSVVVAWIFLRQPAGHYVRAVRDDEQAARALGVRARRYKLYAMALSAGMTAIAGGYYAMYAMFVDPTVVLGLGFSIVIALAAVLGGATSLWGPLVGASTLILLQQVTRTLYSGAGTGLDFVVYGGLVVVIAIVEPRGLVGLVRRLHRTGGA